MRRSVWRRRRRFPREIGAAAVVVALLLAAFAIDRLRPPTAALTGHAIAVDGDTLRLGATRIRLTGLDAPELDQTCSDARGPWPCGEQARAFVADTLSQRSAACAPSGRDAYRRTLATCTVDGADLGQAVVAAGWAVSDGGYLLDEAAARTAGRGIWSGTFEPPAQWRRDHGLPEPGLWDWIRSWFQ
jgi:endonuclease YncB( thermonuclease family)